MVETIYVQPSATAPDGQSFTVLTSGGVKEECMPYPKLFDDPLEAIAAYHEELQEFTAGAKRLYVRSYPETNEIDGKFVVYSRLAVA